MKVVILYGSPRKNGVTARLVEAFCSALPDSADVRLFSAYEQLVAPCRSCGVCSEKWDCPYEDMDVLLGALLECDLLVIASPVYYLTFPAPLKAIVDRTQRCYSAHRQGRSPFAAKQRQAVVLLAAGAPSESGEVIRQQLRWVLPSLNAELRGMMVCANTDSAGVTTSAIEQAIRLGGMFAEE